MYSAIAPNNQTLAPISANRPVVADVECCPYRKLYPPCKCFHLETISKRKVTTTSCCYGKAVAGSGKRRYQSKAQAN
jgi:hypothetical protein